MKVELQRKPSKPGEAVMRFGDWRKRQPTVLLDNRQWVAYGKPETVTVDIPVPRR